MQDRGLDAVFEYLSMFPEAPVEARGAILSIALESLSNHLMKVNAYKSEGTLGQASWPQLRRDLLELIRSRSVCEHWTAAQVNIMSSRIKNLNAASNFDKLTRFFRLLHVRLYAGERAAIEARNKLLHTGRLLDPQRVTSRASTWRVPYRLEMRLYTAVNKLLLAWLGYEGPAIDWGRSGIGTNQLKYVFVGAKTGTANAKARLQSGMTAGSVDLSTSPTHTQEVP
jgi:hypothetical protein